ncbi:MAG: DUF5683 domain-containing protein [Saprospiraceae bacterium]
MKFLIYVVLLLSIFTKNGISQFSDTTSTQTAEFYKKDRRNIFKGEPGKAAFYSLVIPGGGQIYNKDYWKVPLVYVAEGAAVYYLITNTQSYNKWNTCYESIINNQIDRTTCSTNNRTITDLNTASRIRITARTNRELSYIAVGLAHLLNIVEAYVDRHLTLFDTSDDLTFMEISEMSNFEPQVTLVKIRIPLK